MKFVALCALFFLQGCSSLGGAPQEGKRTYSYMDVSGSYKLQREIKSSGKKIITRGQIFQTAGGTGRVLEKSIVVAQKGTIGKGKKRLLAMRPVASEFTVWLEGKRYHSRTRLVPEKRSVRLTLESPETKWQGESLVPVPKGRFFCFYSQIPECLYHSGLLAEAQEKKALTLDFTLVWDNYPFGQEQLTGAGRSLFSPASVKFEGEVKGRLRYLIEVDEQVILYHFSKSYNLEKMAWISQGITVVPPGEEESEIEDQ